MVKKDRGQINELIKQLRDIKKIIVSYSVFLGYKKSEIGCVGSCARHKVRKNGKEERKSKVEWCDTCEKDIENTKVLMHINNLLRDRTLREGEIKKGIKFLSTYLKKNDVEKELSDAPSGFLVPNIPDLKSWDAEEDTTNKKERSIKIMKPSIKNYEELKSEGKKETDIAKLFGLHLAAYYQWKKDAGIMGGGKVSKVQKNNEPKKIEEKNTVAKGSDGLSKDKPKKEAAETAAVSKRESKRNEESVKMTKDNLPTERKYCIDLKDEGLVNSIKSYYKEEIVTLIQSSELEDLKTAAEASDKMKELVKLLEAEHEG